MEIKFTKMHGCGNDYVYINGAEVQIPYDDKPQIVRQLSDRHFGIGGDGVIFINPVTADTVIDDPHYNEAADGKVDAEMEMWNADGSRGEMCGNGIRCVAKYVYDRGMVSGEEFNIVSYGKVKRITVTVEDGKAVTARVNMGPAILDSAEIPVLAGNGQPYPEGEGNPVVSETIMVAGKDYQMTCVSMGNPHAVVFVDNTERFPVNEIGPFMENHYRFPKRTNTEFVQILDRTHVNMRVYERGTGETLACGTGCCATAVACMLNDRTDDEIDINVLGGQIHVAWDRAANQVYMTGPAAEVFEGIISI